MSETMSEYMVCHGADHSKKVIVRFLFFNRQVSRRRRCFGWQRCAQRRCVCRRWRRCHASHADCSGRSRLKTIEAAVASIAWKKNHMNHWKQTHDSACLLKLPSPRLRAYYDACESTEILQTHQNAYYILPYLQINRNLQNRNSSIIHLVCHRLYSWALLHQHSMFQLRNAAPHYALIIRLVSKSWVEWGMGNHQDFQGHRGRSKHRQHHQHRQRIAGCWGCWGCWVCWGRGGCSGDRCWGRWRLPRRQACLVATLENPVKALVSLHLAALKSLMVALTHVFPIRNWLKCERVNGMHSCCVYLPLRLWEQDNLEEPKGVWSVGLSGCLSVCLSFYLSIYLSVCLSIYLSIYLPTYLSIYLSS